VTASVSLMSRSLSDAAIGAQSSAAWLSPPVVIDREHISRQPEIPRNIVSGAGADDEGQVVPERACGPSPA
jgi:hypothetical protein